MQTEKAMRTMLATLLLALGCGGMSGALHRAESAYDEARYEDATTWLEDVEPGVHGADPSLRARFHYLRGMTAFHLKDARRARYHLALANVLSEDDRDRVLGVEWSKRLDRTLQGLTGTSVPSQ